MATEYTTGKIQATASFLLLIYYIDRWEKKLMTKNLGSLEKNFSLS